REQSGWAEVDVLVEGEAQLEQQPALENARGDSLVPRVSTYRAEQDRLVSPQLLENGVGQNLSGREIAVRAEVVLRRVDLGVVRREDRTDDLLRFGGHFRADAIPGDGGHVDASRHGPLPYSGSPYSGSPVLQCP